jgi:cellulose synthase (UDP-forming)
MILRRTPPPEPQDAERTLRATTREAAIPERGDARGVGGTPQTRAGIWWEEHPFLVRAVTSLALAWGAAWLLYRFAFSWHGVNPIAFVALAFVELYNLVSLALLALPGWRWEPTEPPPASSGWNVDVFVCTYDEPEDVVEATLAGCAALRYPHTTYLLDDGRRDTMRELAERWGAVWVTRPDNKHAKAGNINHALQLTSGDLIFFLDADHVPLPDALDLTVGYFDDPAVALVQSPHDFYNQDSVQHYDVGRHEQSLFFEVICPGKDRHNAAFWCGSATVVRRQPLEEVGGVATETIAEDFHTTIKMHRNRWRTHYLNRVLVQGLAPVDLDGYLLQRDRWARGNLAVFRLPESPLRRKSGLTPMQRLHYFASLFAYGAGLPRLLMLGLLVVTLAFGVLPAHVTMLPLLTLWVPATILAITASAALCRGHMRLRESSHYVLLTAAVFTRALRCAVLPSKTKFKVTPKDGVDAGGWHSVRRLQTVLVLGGALSVALIVRAFALAGVISMPELPGLALPLAVGLGIWELTRVMRTVKIVATRRQRRARYRFPCMFPAVMRSDIGVTSGTVLDLAGTGLSIATDLPVERGTTIDATSTVEDANGELQFVKFHAIVRSCRAVPGAGWVLGTELSEIHDESWRRLMTFCYVVYPMRQLRARPEPTPLVMTPARDSDAVLGDLQGAVAEIESGRARPAPEERVPESR